MKKTVTKLTLKRDTLRVLTNQSLADARGGINDPSLIENGCVTNLNAEKPNR